MASGVVRPGEENRRSSRHSIDTIGRDHQCRPLSRGDHTNQMVPIFLALRAGRRRLPFTDPFKRGIRASYVVPLYARRNDALIYKDAWSIWNLCLLLAQRPELQLRLGEPIRMENLLRDLKQHRLPVVHAHLTVRTESVEIRTAMRGATSFIHSVGVRNPAKFLSIGPKRCRRLWLAWRPSRIPGVPESSRSTSRRFSTLHTSTSSPGRLRLSLLTQIVWSRVHPYRRTRNRDHGPASRGELRPTIAAWNCSCALAVRRINGRFFPFSTRLCRG